MMDNDNCHPDHQTQNKEGRLDIHDASDASEEAATEDDYDCYIVGSRKIRKHRDRSWSC